MSMAELAAAVAECIAAIQLLTADTTRPTENDDDERNGAQKEPTDDHL
jgi:hypothetical protein